MTRAMQQKIHIGCRQLGLDADDRRAMQVEVCGKASMRDMTEADLKLVIKRLQKDGFKPVSKGHKKHKAAPRADLRLVHVIWKKLGDAGALERPDRAGLNAFIRARFGDKWQSVPADVDMLRDHTQIEAVINALVSWGKRAKIDFDWARHGK